MPPVLQSHSKKTLITRAPLRELKNLHKESQTFAQNKD